MQHQPRSNNSRSNFWLKHLKKFDKKSIKDFKGWSLVTKRTKIHSNSWGADEIKDMPNSKDFG